MDTGVLPGVTLVNMSRWR